MLFIFSLVVACWVCWRIGKAQSQSGDTAPQPVRSEEAKPLPIPDKLEFMVRGWSHPTQRDGVTIRNTLYTQMKIGQSLRLVRQPGNPFDPNAILIYPSDGPLARTDLGFVPRQYAASLAPLMDRGHVWTAKVKKIPVRGAGGRYVKLYAEATSQFGSLGRYSPVRLRVFGQHRYSEIALGFLRRIVRRSFRDGSPAG